MSFGNTVPYFVSFFSMTVAFWFDVGFLFLLNEHGKLDTFSYTILFFLGTSHICVRYIYSFLFLREGKLGNFFNYLSFFVLLRLCFGRGFTARVRWVWLVWFGLVWFGLFSCCFVRRW